MAKIKHIALFKFKEGTTEEQIQKTFDELMELSENVPGIEDYVAGANNNPEGMNKGYTHGFVMSFTDPAERDGYIPRPEHERVKPFVLPLVEDSVVVDFEV